MPPRKAQSPLVPATTVAVVPVDPDAGITFADHRTASAMMLRTLAGLDTATALDRLRALYASLPNGTARRAVLAARLAVLRDDLPRRLPVPAPPPVPAVVVKAPPKTGALSTLALDAAARLLMEAGAEDIAPPVARTPKAAPQVADLFAALAAADDDDADADAGNGGNANGPAQGDAAMPVLAAAPDEGAAEGGAADGSDPVAAPDALTDGFAAAGSEIAQPAPVAKLASARSKPRKGIPAPMDAAAIAAMMLADQGEEDAPVFVPTPPPVMAAALSAQPELDAQPELNDGSDEAPLAPVRPGLDLGAAFAAMSIAFGDSDEVPLVPPSDLTLADTLTAMDAGTGTGTGTGTGIGASAGRRGHVAPLPDDDIAASLSALIGEGDDPTAPDMAEAEVAGRLASIDPAAATPARPKPRRARPTDLSDVSAAFAEMDGDSSV